MKKMKVEQLINGNYYHIYNRGNNRMNLFSIPSDFEHFLELYDKYISPVADTLAWALMPNHLHLLVRIKENMVYKYSKSSMEANKPVDSVEWEKWFEEHKWETIDLSAYAVPENVGDDDNVGNGKLNGNRYTNTVGLKPNLSPVPYRHFSHLFNAYTRYYHNRTGGCGNLFERPFKRKRIDNEEYRKRVILYVHNNPVHHGFCSHSLEYSWSSYLSCISEKPTKIKREAIINLFGNNQNFKSEHTKPVDIEFMDKWLDIGIDYVTDVSDLPDLSVYAVPDNVKPNEMKTECAAPDNDNVKSGIDNVERFQFNVDRVCPITSGTLTLSGWRDEDLSAFAEPDNVKRYNGPDNVERYNKPDNVEWERGSEYETPDNVINESSHYIEQVSHSHQLKKK